MRPSFFFESYLKCKPDVERNNEISLGDFLKNRKMCCIHFKKTVYMSTVE